ncbi:MAG TPA: hypothetical protein VNO83_15975 [Pseudonocardia sp.]|nr:hypothetical protein [Pseudonocardia sp.]
MITTTFVDVHGTRLRTGYVAPSARPSGKGTWQPTPPALLCGFMINNSTGVSGVECRRR